MCQYSSTVSLNLTPEHYEHAPLGFDDLVSSLTSGSGIFGPDSARERFFHDVQSDGIAKTVIDADVSHASRYCTSGDEVKMIVNIVHFT